MLLEDFQIEYIFAYKGVGIKKPIFFHFLAKKRTLTFKFILVDDIELGMEEKELEEETIPLTNETR